MTIDTALGWSDTDAMKVGKFLDSGTGKLLLERLKQGCNAAYDPLSSQPIEGIAVRAAFESGKLKILQEIQAHAFPEKKKAAANEFVKI